MKRLLASFFLTALLSTLTLPALAATFRTGETVKVTAPLNDNAYILGSQVTIDQPVQGDLITAGGNVLVKAAVKQDLFAAGGTVFIDGVIGGDLRVAGGNLVLSGTIGGDLMAAGGSITLMDGSSVKGDVSIGGGDITLGGTVGGTVTVRGGQVRLGSIVKGDIDIQAEDITLKNSVDGSSLLVAKTITLDPGARLMRDVHFWSAEGEGQFADAGAQIKGKITYDAALLPLRNKTFDGAGKAAGAGIIAAIIGVGGFFLFSATLVILLLVLLTKTFFMDAARFLSKKAWTSFLYGFLFFAATPVAAFLFLISIIGIPIALFISTMYSFAIVFAKPLTAIVLTRTVELRRGYKWGKPMIMLVSVLFYVALKIVALIPIVGWMVTLVTVLFAYGAVVATKWSKIQKVR
ncbi:MAG: polymer-forming cytoskeletal protein [Candidatus Peribacteraceae bacterium]|nr:polymer-forming cytoskeletal protein [Candidatus Peribacteraceae bacterium]MDD5742720.1 polymer-forming cytoskeletal protein [Candidatus Peribacteraceae bacterium]